jgi:hypothetical protein
MVLPEDSEESKHTYVKDIGTGQQEEVSQHLIAAPENRKVGEEIENMISVPVPVYGFVNLGDERFKSLRWIQTAYFDTGAISHEWLVAGETEVEDLLTVFQDFVSIGIYEKSVFLNRTYLPDYVVSGDQSGKETIELLQSGT